MKEYKRVLGIDDGPFDRESDNETLMVGVMSRLDGYVEGIVARKVIVDGNDATDRVISMFRSHFSSQIDYVILNGVTFAGFNVCDITEINRITGLPVVSITRRKPDIEMMKAALRKHFSDAEERIEILEKLETKEIKLGGDTSLYINTVGITESEARELIRKTIIRGNIPEPVRLAHMIAGALKNGENRGRS